MDAEVDSTWMCTQAVVSTDSQSDNEQEKIDNYGCIVLNNMIDNGRYVLKEGDNTIGRHPLNHIYIEHPSVSMNHAVIQCDSDGVVLLDKGSLNKTKLNKKTLRKDVAYFLEENALLVFGEVRAHYFMNERSNEFTNDTKSIAPDNTYVHKATLNDGLSLSKLSNAVITPKSIRTDTPNAIIDCNLSLVIENTCEIEKEVPKTITGTECAMDILNNIHTKLNSSSPSDEYLLEALSQVEAKQINVNSNEIFHNLSNEDTPVMNVTESMPEITREDPPSPVMDLKSSILTTLNVTKKRFQSPNKMNTEVIREDTPSPVMDLKSFIVTTNNVPKNMSQSPSNINSKLIREETPSPIMDLGCYNDFENTFEIINHDIISAIQSPNKVNEFDNTQVLEIDNNIVELYTQTSNNDDILFFKAQKVKPGEQLNTQINNSSDIQSSDSLSDSKNINLNTKCNVKPTNLFCRKNKIQNDDINNDSFQNKSMVKCFHSKTASDGHYSDKRKKIVNTFEADDDDVFRNFIENESQQHDLAILENQDFFNCSAQKIPIDKNINSKSKLSSSIHDKETRRPPEFKQLNKTNTIISKNYITNAHENLNKISEMDDDFFNCPTQKISTTKKIQPKPKVSSSIHEEETQIPPELKKCNKTDTITSMVYSSNKHEENTQILEMDDDFFNCPTQKISIKKKIQPKPKISPSIHEEETQIPPELKKCNKTDTITSKVYSTNIHEENTQIPEMDDDFFNCPTQKVSITKKIQPKPKISPSIHEEETQIPPELKKCNKTDTITSKVYSTNIHEENTQILEMDDDFFNCPTQKISITKKIQPKPKISPSIHEEETQIPPELKKCNKTDTITSKVYSTNIHEENTQIPEMDDDFFNCPTQKVSITKKIQPKPKISPSIHEEETQIPPELKKCNKTDTITSKVYSTNIHEENTQIPEMDDDFFNCPTQKVSITKKIQPKPKISPSIHEEETQIPPELKKCNKTDTITSKVYSTNIHEENTQIPEMDDDFFNCPTQKVSITKKIQPKPKISPSIHEEETQIPPELKKCNKTDTITSKVYSTNIHEENTQIPEMDDDFFNCPTQKVSITKKIQPKPKISPSIHEEETQIPPELKKCNKTDTITSKVYSTNIHEENTQIPEMDDDFFNCPTQKVSITKKIQPKPKISPSIHEEETQIPPELKKCNKTDTITSKVYSTNIHEENTQIPEMDDDFFNCPTQKVSITKNIQPKPKISPSIHEEETQIPPELKKCNKTDTITSKVYSTNIHEENTQIPEMDDDFFNCPTQKVSITKKIQPKPKISPSIHEEETQIPPELKKCNKTDTITSKVYSTNIHEENTQIPEMDDDFFNCPTQKVSITKKIQPKPKISPSIHEEETQIPPELKKCNKTDTITSKVYSTNIHEENTQIPEMDDDFFNCPTQKVSITKKIQPKPKISPSIHEEETQIPPELKKCNKTDTITSKVYSTNIHEENTQIPEMDDDFFNCPTQKVSITKNIQPKPKVSSSIHEEETQIPPELKKCNKTDTITSKVYSTNIHEENTQILEMDDDFFNCPTQKVSITKNIQQKPKGSSSIDEKETQIPLELKKCNKTDTITSMVYSTNIHEENTQILEMDDDFFNCPTQKVSITKNIQPKPKVSSSIHEEETQIPLELKKCNKTDTITSMVYSTNIHEGNTQIPEMDDDFFNCPTQKVSITKNIQPKPKGSSSIHEEETQIPLELKKCNKTDTITSMVYSTNIHEGNTQIPEMDDDFFNCPTQKVSITKKIQPKPKVFSSIHEEETQVPPELKKCNKTDTITSMIYSTNIHEGNTQIPEMDDDFFNCPTQKLSITKTINPKPKVSSTMQEKETQRPPEFLQFNKTNTIALKTNATNIHKDLTEIPEMDDFFNCPTQKIAITKNINQLPYVFTTKHEENTQKPLELTQLNKSNINISPTNSANKCKVLIGGFKIDDNDFFNCPTEKLSCNSNSKISMGCKKHKSVSTIINEAKTQDLSIQSISKISLLSNIKQNTGNIFNYTTQKVQSNSISNCSINLNEDVTMNPEHFDKSYNHKQTVEPDNEDRCKVQKSKCIKSNTIRLSNVQLPVNCNEKSSNSLKINKPKMQVRENVHNMSYSGDSSNNSANIFNKPNENTELNNINTKVPFNKNFDSPSCSNTATIKENYVNASSSTKQKYFADDSVQSQVSVSLKYKHQMKRMDESIFSPLNIPDVSANSLLHHSSPKISENNLNTLNCEPSTSSNDAFKWKSFWNKKKVQSQDKGKSDKQKSIKTATEVKENKERYQTRAITRKRKQNGVVESNKKICNRNKILEPLVENSSEIVVSFSYLKSRHLQEMKQFVDKTGGTVTDEITQCSVLVTDKIRCTMKILSAIARGCPIVNANWLKHSYTVKMFQDVDDFIIVDKDAERKYKFQLKESLAKAKAKRLLDGYNVLVTPSVKPGPQEMKVIITCAGGNYVLNWTTTQYTKELIVTCDKDRARWKSAWDNDLAKIIDSDTLVMSIIRQKLTI